MDATSKFLFESSVLLNKINPICHQLRDKAIERCKEEKKKIKIDRTIVCKWCYNSWIDGQMSIRIRPQKRKLKKSELEKLQLPPVPMNQLKFNNLVMKCLVCKKNTKQYLCNIRTPKVKTVQEDIENTIAKKKKKKKKKKDKFAGLNLSAAEDKISSKEALNLDNSENLENSKPPNNNHLKPEKSMTKLINKSEINNSIMQSISKKLKKKPKKHKPKKKKCSLLSKFIKSL